MAITGRPTQVGYWWHADFTVLLHLALRVVAAAMPFIPPWRDLWKKTSSMGETLIAKQSTAVPDEDAERPSWQHLFTFTTHSHLPILIPAISVCAIHGLVSALQAIFIGRIYKGFTDFGAREVTHLQFRNVINDNVLALIGLAIASWVLSSAFLSLWIGFGELQARTARLQIFDGLLAKPMTFFDTLPSGVRALSPRLQTQIRELQLSTSQPLGSTIQSLATAIASIAIAFQLSWSLTLILLGSMPVNALVISLISSRMQRHVDDQASQLAIAAQHSSNAFSNIETVKCFNGQHTEYKRFSAPIKRAAHCYIRQVRGNALQMGWMMFATFVTFLGGFYYGSSIIRSGKSTTADFITTFFCCLEVANAIKEVLPQMLVLEKGRAAGCVLRTLCSADASDNSKRLDVVPTESPGEISFKIVSFAYPARPDDLVLKSVSCSFAAGETTFIIGHSGSGKSTLAQLLLRLYGTKQGDTLLDETPLACIDKAYIRKIITLVEQSSVIFTGSIAENIALGADRADSVTSDDIKDATDFALLTNTLRDFPQGIDTLVGLGGSSLSGGQRQRIALARARLREAPVLILDESTNALDYTARSLILAAIRQWRRNKTTIFISHDTSMVEPDDYVHILDEGVLVASGYRSTLDDSGNEAFSTLAPSKEEAFSESGKRLKPQPSAPEISLAAALNSEL